jgi:hypothetical protein
MELDLTLTPHEATLIILWSETTIHGGHWGDGDVVFPDEGNALEKLRHIKKGEPVKFTARDVEIIMIWMHSHCGALTSAELSLTAEESQLVKKLKAAAPESGD